MATKFTGILQIVQPEIGRERDFAIILYAPPEISMALDDIRRRYDPAFKANIPPHITVKRPTPLGTPENLDKLPHLLQEVTQTLRPFDVHLNGYDVFPKAECNVVFLKALDEAPLRHLHQQVIQNLSKIYPNGNADALENDKYHPHLTIGNKLTNLELPVMEHELQSGKFQLNFEFVATEIGLMVEKPGEKPSELIWETIGHYKFGGERQG